MGVALAGALTALVTAPAGAGAVTLEPIGSATYDDPTYVTSDPENPDRLFVTEQDGTVWETTPSGTRLFLDLEAETTDPGGTEEGLWSIAFAPHAGSDLFYVAYSFASGHLPIVAEYRERATPAETEATGRLVIGADEDNAFNHNGGQLQYGPDGFLYWSLGDDANGANAQDLASDRGKILRLDPSGSTSGIVWASGLRNPWRFSFDRATGAMFIADVGDIGADAIEEVDLGVQGRNFGWPDCEGPCANPAFANPLYAYDHDPGASNCAIIGGYVVRDPDLGDLFGRYLFSDLCGGDLRSIDPSAPPVLGGHRVEPLSVDSPRSFGEDACGRVYVVAAQSGGGAGQVFRLEGPTSGACPPTPPDGDPPQTSLRLKRKNERGTRYVARIRSDEANSTFECKLDRRRWKPCGAKRKLRRLEPGRHRFRARATDAAGNTDPRPAKQRFRTKRR